MAGRGRMSARRLDQVDRRSLVGVSGAMRARDVSRPDEETIAAAEAEVNEKGPAEERRRTPRNG